MLLALRAVNFGQRKPWMPRATKLLDCRVGLKSSMYSTWQVLYCPLFRANRVGWCKHWPGYWFWWWRPEQVWKGCCLGWQLCHVQTMREAMTLLCHYYIIISYCYTTYIYIKCWSYQATRLAASLKRDPLDIDCCSWGKNKDKLAIGDLRLVQPS